MRISNLKQDQGVAGTTVLLGLIVSLFVIGLLVMIFALMGGSLQTAADTPTAATVTGETGAYINATGYTVDEATAAGFRNFAVTSATNSSGSLIGAGNYTYTQAGVIRNVTTATFTGVILNYTYTYDANNTATEVIADTTSSIASVTTFFSLFIVIGSMVVLILLTVIIIVAIKQSGMLGDGTA